MTYKQLGLAALIISALRSAVADPALQEQVDAQADTIGQVRARFDELSARLEAIASSNDALDAEQSADLQGIKDELAQLADALTGPADDPEDSGVIAEVEPAEGTETSPTADAIVADAPTPEGDADEALDQGDQGGEAGASGQGEQDQG